MTRVRGELKRVTLGRHPTLKLAEARTLAREGHGDGPSGPRPGRGQASHPAAGGRPIERVIGDYTARAQKARGRRAGHEVERSLDRELAPWRGRPIETITRADVLELLDAIVDRGSPRDW